MCVLQYQAQYINRIVQHAMDIDLTQSNEAIFDECQVCKQLPTDVCASYSEFCVRVAKNGSLTQVVNEAVSAMPTFMQCKKMHNSCAEIGVASIKHHVLYCIGTREPVVTRLITQNVVMGTMMKSSDATKTLACAKLLLQCVGSDSKG